MIKFEKLRKGTSALSESTAKTLHKIVLFFIFFITNLSAELNRLWNLCPDNMAACRSKDRDFLPTLEHYFEEAIEQLDPSIESQYK